MTRFTRHASLALVGLLAASGLVIDQPDARGGFVSSALVGVLDTTVPASQLTVTFRAVDRFGHVVWEADPGDLKASPAPAGGLQFQAPVPDDVTTTPGVEMVMWIHAVKARDSVKASSFKLEGRSTGAVAAPVSSKDLRGRVGEVIGSMK